MNKDIPTTVEELYTAINKIFECRGHYIGSYINVGDQRIMFNTYINGKTHNEGGLRSIESYHIDSKEAVKAAWLGILLIRDGSREHWTQEALADFGDDPIIKPLTVWWRFKPALTTTSNNLYIVTLRAAFI